MFPKKYTRKELKNFLSVTYIHILDLRIAIDSLDFCKKKKFSIISTLKSRCRELFKMLVSFLKYLISVMIFFLNRDRDVQRCIIK